MATVYVTEFGGFGPPSGVVDTPKVASNNVAITAGSVQSAAFNPNTAVLRVHADAICSVEIGGSNPTATAASQRMAAGTTEYFYVRAGDKLAVITNT